jgi:hypothetical protein
MREREHSNRNKAGRHMMEAVVDCLQSGMSPTEIVREFQNATNSAPSVIERRTAETLFERRDRFARKFESLLVLMLQNGFGVNKMRAVFAGMLLKHTKDYGLLPNKWSEARSQAIKEQPTCAR